VSGLVRHPVLAYKVSKLLSPPAPTDWREAVRSFVARAGASPDLPRPLLVTCGDEELRFGGDGPPALEVHAGPATLVAVFNGDVHPGQAWLDGHLQLLGETGVLMRFAGLAQRLMFGAGDG
jgi:hypothetical protein